MPQAVPNKGTSLLKVGARSQLGASIFGARFGDTTTGRCNHCLGVSRGLTVPRAAHTPYEQSPTGAAEWQTALERSHPTRNWRSPVP